MSHLRIRGLLGYKLEIVTPGIFVGQKGRLKPKEVSLLSQSQPGSTQRPPRRAQASGLHSTERYNAPVDANVTVEKIASTPNYPSSPDTSLSSDFQY